ncbi:MAG: signal peptidase I [Desulfobacteraceae bacterium]|nr:signal peptidase I [Desulfobacteraceae bacterium]
MKKTSSIAINILIVWLGLVVIGLLLLPRVAGWRFDAVLTGSMEPALNVGGVVVIRPVDIAIIREGDIIAFHSGELIVTHRVVEVTSSSGGTSFITKGDAVEDPDLQPVSAENVMGKVIFHAPYFGYFAAFVKTPLGILLAVLIPATAIIVLEVKNIRGAAINNKIES